MQFAPSAYSIKPYSCTQNKILTVNLTNKLGKFHNQVQMINNHNYKEIFYGICTGAYSIKPYSCTQHKIIQGTDDISMVLYELILRFLQKCYCRESCARFSRTTSDIIPDLGLPKITLIACQGFRLQHLFKNLVLVVETCHC